MKRAFTLIELLVAITILLILVGTVGLGVSNSRRANRDSKRLADAILITQAVDQSMLNNGGSVPRISGQAVDCASNIPLKNVHLFPDSSIPRDPRIFSLATTCTSALNGYTYHTRYSAGTPSNHLKVNRYTYALEIGLENPLAATHVGTFQSGNTLGPGEASRYQYFLNGGFCGSSCYK
jgi:prepilin-type N-terminal cleavage/methylation domain-containing protein